MARRRDGRVLAALTGTRARHRRSPGGLVAVPDGGSYRATSGVPGMPGASRGHPLGGEAAPDGSVRLTGTCSCGRERTDAVPGATGTRWFRGRFVECECGQLLLLIDIGGSTSAADRGADLPESCTRFGVEA